MVVIKVFCKIALLSQPPPPPQDSELQYISTAVDSVLAKMGNIEWGALEYK